MEEEKVKQGALMQAAESGYRFLLGSCAGGQDHLFA